MNTLLKPAYGNTQLTARQILRDPLLFLAFGFGSGLSRYMPGTMGTIAAIPLYLLLMATDNVTVYGVATLVATVLGVWICQYAADKLAVHDFGGIVWDEVAGLLITMLGFSFSWPVLLAGFVLFRLFDIVKPWPIRWVDKRIHGGLGIMLDDVLAALLANLVLHLIF